MPAEHMIAARYYGPGQPLRLESTPVPVPALGETLLRVRAAGVCHTELQLLDGVLNLGVVPLTPGHEVVGEVVESRGPSVVGPGERVLLYYYAPCGGCRYCRGGTENLCPNAARQVGFSSDGGYAEYLVAPSTSLIPLPDHLSDAEAAGLACGGATALHAARSIGRVELGETVVVYGVGGVGLYLVQICRLAGARVVAVGRTPEKLELARQLGAFGVVDARDVDPLTVIHGLTDGNGADVVFDLVANAETMSICPRLLARRGRLVFTGYSEDHLDLNPLHLVLREIQVLGAVGNTLAELRQTVDLAARGELRSVVGPAFPLERANDALDALRNGRITGRAVLVPLGVAQPDVRVLTEACFNQMDERVDGRDAAEPGVVGGSRVFATDGGGVSRGIPSTVPSSREGNGGGDARGEAPASSNGSPFPMAGVAVNPSDSAAPAETPSGRVVVRREQITPKPGPRPFEAELLEVIGRGLDVPFADADFDALARGLFTFQYERNAPYRRYCEIRGASPASVTHWTEIPAVPIAAFKEAVLACEPVDDAAALFMSSGTTRPEQRSRHYHPSLAVYDASIRTNFAALVLPEIDSTERSALPFLVLNPRPEALPNSSLAYYLGRMVEWYGATGSGFFVDEAGLQGDRLLEVLRAAVAAARPVALLGTTFAFVHLLDRMVERDERVALPAGSRVFDTGGIKGRSREIEPAELAVGLTERLRVPLLDQVNMYGLTELSTQFIDGNIARRARGEVPTRSKIVPPWARTRILDPETLEELPIGQAGVLCHTDLANRASVCTILTEDLGVARDDGFEILGRVKGSAARGCSIAMDELLSAVGRSG